MRHADAGGHGHGRVGHGDVLHINRADPFAAGLDHVLAAVGYLHVAIGVDGGHVARGEPTIDERVTALAFEISPHHPRSLDMQVAKGFAIPRQVIAFRVDNLHVYTKNGAPLLQADLHLIGFRQVLVFVFKRAQGAQRAHLCHAPGMQNFDTIVVVEGSNHGRRAGRAANHRALERCELQAGGLHVAQQHLPDGGHAGGVGDFFGFQQLVNRFAIHRRAWKHQLGAGQWCRVRNAPGVDMEHGHHGQDSITRRQAHHIRQSGGISMQGG